MEERLYDEYARIQGYHWWFRGRRAIVGAVIGSELGSMTPGARILDVGCGTGTNLALLRRFGEVQGVESELAAVEFCRRNGEPDVEHHLGSDLPFPDTSFDLVTLLDVIEHVEDDRVLLEEALRTLVPGGHVLVTVPAYMWMWGAQDEIAHHHRRYTRPQLRSSLAGAGFVPRRLTYFNSILFAPVAAIRLARRLRPADAEPHSDFEMNRPGPFNSLLAGAFSSEARLVRRMDLPFGVSILCLARRP